MHLTWLSRFECVPAIPDSAFARAVAAHAPSPAAVAAVGWPVATPCGQGYRRQLAAAALPAASAFIEL